MPNDTHYTVLARKYRPRSLSELVGQDMLVQTLSNAIAQQRLPHAFILTGIRGVGKTSTARILARSLLCEGANSDITAPTTSPCGTCKQCTAIASDSHVDVLEVDAASRTGVGDIREIIESANYAPVHGRYKIYIIDEVHMLSKSAFNALLKTLEEPPEHIKFIFATTEIRKIPVTILSRCMRFDLPRIDTTLLAKHFGEIAQKENTQIEDSALNVIAYAAEGSVRDGLSLLDQVIGTYSNANKITRSDVDSLIGISSKDNTYTLFTHLAKGEAKEAVLLMRDLYGKGSEPLMVLNDLATAVHFVTQLKVIPDANYTDLYAEIEVEEGQKLADKLSIPYLARLWQMVNKGISETTTATNPLISSEMVIVRIAYMSDLPSPAKLAGDVKKNSTHSIAGSTTSVQTDISPAQEIINNDNTKINSFNSLLELFKEKHEPFLASYLCELNVVNFDQNTHTLEYQDLTSLPPSLSNDLSTRLREWTGDNWQVTKSLKKGTISVNKANENELEKRRSRAVKEQHIQNLLIRFNGAKIVDFSEQITKNK